MTWENWTLERLERELAAASAAAAASERRRLEEVYVDIAVRGEGELAAAHLRFFIFDFKDGRLSPRAFAHGARRRGRYPEGVGRQAVLRGVATGNARDGFRLTATGAAVREAIVEKIESHLARRAAADRLHRHFAATSGVVLPPSA